MEVEAAVELIVDAAGSLRASMGHSPVAVTVVQRHWLGYALLPDALLPPLAPIAATAALPVFVPAMLGCFELLPLER